MSTLKRCIPIIITHLAFGTSVSTLATAFNKGTFSKDLQVLKQKAAQMRRKNLPDLL